MYSDGHSTYVTEERLTKRMEGASRPTHFRGVTTVVAKLFNLTRPDIAVFGAKDWQQSIVISRMVDDLNFPVRIVIAPTVREADGLAMSSRNRYLKSAERTEATVLVECIRLAKRLVNEANSHLNATVRRPTEKTRRNQALWPGWITSSFSTPRHWNQPSASVAAHTWRWLCFLEIHD